MGGWEKGDGGGGGGGGGGALKHLPTHGLDRNQGLQAQSHRPLIIADLVTDGMEDGCKDKATRDMAVMHRVLQCIRVLGHC